MPPRMSATDIEQEEATMRTLPLEVRVQIKISKTLSKNIHPIHGAKFIFQSPRRCWQVQNEGCQHQREPTQWDIEIWTKLERIPQ